MHRFLRILLCTCHVALLQAQPYSIGHTTITFTDPARSNRSIATEIYYPADVAGNNVAVTTATLAKFPMLSFGHGFVMTWDAYQNIWETVVPEGYIIAFPKTEGSIAPSHGAFGLDLTFVLTAMLNENANAASLFFGRVDTMTAVMGHSMGGGAAFLSTNNNPLIKTLVTLAPAETNPSAIGAALGVSIPTLIFAGGNDCVTPQATNQQPMYDNIQASCKSYVSITGGSHCQMANNNFLCSLGEATCSPQPTISRAAQHAIIDRYLIPWLNYQLKNDCQAGLTFDSLLTSVDITSQKQCTFCTTVSTPSVSATEIQFLSNPFHENITMQLSPAAALKTVSVFNVLGKLMIEQRITSGEKNVSISSRQWNDGIYFVKITSESETATFKLLKVSGH
jgi:pimeloyl-ACP methyl ester carboxylesterase